MILGLLATSSCSDNTTNDPDGPTICPPATGERVAFTAASDTVFWHVEASAGRQILGAGFNPNAAYLSDACVKAPVLDLDKIRDYDENRVVVLSNRSGSQTSVASADAGGLLNALAAKTRVLDDGEVAPLCAGTLLDDEAFQRDIDHSSMFSFAYNTADLSYYILRVNVMLSEVRRQPEKYLSDAFIADLEQLSAEELIGKYGTHVLTGVNTGLSVRSVSRITVLEQEGKETSDWKREVADYYALWARAKFGVPSPIISKNSQYEGKYCGGTTSVTFAGGDASLLDASDPTTGADAWQKKGCTADNAALLEILDAPVPLYELVGDETKAEALCKATKLHLDKNKLTSIETKLLVQTWAGGFYRYTTTYDSQQDGGVCGIFTNPSSDMVPLYAYDAKNCFMLSTQAPDSHWKLMGYIYASQQPGTVPLYAASVDGSVQTYCSLDDQLAYGVEGTWKKTGILGYVLPLTCR